MSEYTVVENPKELEWLAENDVTSLASQMMGMAGNASEVTDRVVERLSNRPGIAVLERAVRLSRAVALVTRSDLARATGFLIAPSRLLTNWHVFPTAEHAEGALAQFNYTCDEYGKPLPVTEAEVHPEEFYHSEEELDYAVVAVSGNPGTRWGVIPLTAGSVKMNQHLCIIQHPLGLPKQIAMGDNEVKYAGETVVQYLTDTMPCCSGSPVFDSAFRIVALHSRSSRVPGSSTGVVYYRNEGIRISAITADLPDLGPYPPLNTYRPRRPVAYGGDNHASLNSGTSALRRRPRPRTVRLHTPHRWHPGTDEIRWP